MKSLAIRAAALLAAATISYFAIAQNQEEIAAVNETISYSTTGCGPKILLLHDSSSQDRAWAKAASKLASHFEVTLLDITLFLNENDGLRQLRQTIRELNIDDTHISGTAQAEHIIQRYALSYPNQTDTFILPHNCEDLETLAILFNSTNSSKS